MNFPSDFLENVDIIFKNEGTYSNDPDDPGVETFFGISRNFHPDWIGWLIVDQIKDSIDLEEDFDLNDLKSLPKLYTFVLDFYFDNFWKSAKIDQLLKKVQRSVFDAAVNMGVKRAIKLLQRAVGVTDDGIIGPITLGAIYRIDPDLLLSNFKLERIKYYTNLVKKYPTYRKYIVGWIDRALRT